MVTTVLYPTPMISVVSVFFLYMFVSFTPIPAMYSLRPEIIIFLY